MKSKEPKKAYRVWFAQVNQCNVDVRAGSKGEAIEKAHRKWRRDYGQTYASYVECEGEQV